MSSSSFGPAARLTVALQRSPGPVDSASAEPFSRTATAAPSTPPMSRSHSPAAGATIRGQQVANAAAGGIPVLHARREDDVLLRDALEAAAIGIAGCRVPVAVAERAGKRLPAMRPAIDDVVGVQPNGAALELRWFRAGPERSQAVREGTLRVEVVLPVAVIESRRVPAQIGSGRALLFTVPEAARLGPDEPFGGRQAEVPPPVVQCRDQGQPPLPADGQRRRRRLYRQRAAEPGQALTAPATATCFRPPESANPSTTSVAAGAVEAKPARPGCRRLPAATHPAASPPSSSPAWNTTMRPA